MKRKNDKKKKYNNDEELAENITADVEEGKDYSPSDEEIKAMTDNLAEGRYNDDDQETAEEYDLRENVDLDDNEELELGIDQAVYLPDDEEMAIDPTEEAHLLAEGITDDFTEDVEEENYFKENQNDLNEEMAEEFDIDQDDRNKKEHKNKDKRK